MDQIYNSHAAWLAQSVEHETLNLRVVGSSPTSGFQYFSQYYIIIVIVIIATSSTLGIFTESFYAAHVSVKYM